MDVHKKARTTPHSRALIAQRLAAGETPAAVARAVGVCDRTVRKWVARAAEGPLALDDRSCRPQRSPRDLGGADGRDSAAAPAPVDRRGHRRGRGAERRDGRRTLGQLGWRTKKLGRIGAIGHRITGDRRRRVRGIGWEFVHVCLDDCSRLAYAEVLGDEQSVTVAAFLRRAVA